MKLKIKNNDLLVSPDEKLSNVKIYLGGNLKQELNIFDAEISLDLGVLRPGRKIFLKVSSNEGTWEEKLQYDPDKKFKNNSSRKSGENTDVSTRNMDGLKEIGIYNGTTINPLIQTYNLYGTAIKLGIVDGGIVRTTHQEFQDSGTSRITKGQSGSVDMHATHVCGTMCAKGVKTSGKGVLPQASVISYNFNNHEENIRSCAATSYNAVNNSYGFILGWNGSFWEGFSYDFYITHYQSSPAKVREDADFGKYNSYSRGIDDICNDYPDCAVCFASGNDANDGPSDGTWHIYDYKTFSWRTMNSSTYPPPDSDGKFDTLDALGTSKNVITVGASRDNSTGTTSFSSGGPTDDFRIKPEVLANGQSVYSCSSSNNTAYTTMSGTSMACPFVTGCCGMIQQFCKEQLSYFPKSATVKACLVVGTRSATVNGNIGYGRVNMNRTLSFLDKVRKQTDGYNLYEATMTNRDSYKQYAYTSFTGGNLHCVLSWNDPKGTATTSGNIDFSVKKIINRLSLYAKHTDANDNVTYYYPYRITSYNGNATMKLSSTQNNNLKVNWDNTQKLIIPNLAGRLDIFVSRENTLSSNQKYSLAIDLGGTASGGGGETNPPDNMEVNDLTINGQVYDTNGLRVNTSSGWINLGPTGTGFCHITTDRSRFYMNKSLWVNGSIRTYNQSNVDFRQNNAMRLRLNNGVGMRVFTTHGSGFFGCRNRGWLHIMTDKSKIYMNKQLWVRSGFIGAYGNNLRLHTHGTERMRILRSNGNVGIGLTSPSEKLHVNGKVRATGYLNFKGIHQMESVNRNILEPGFIVSTVNGKIGANDLPLVNITSKENDNCVMGIVREDSINSDGLVDIASLGEGKVKVVQNGQPIKNGDYICSSVTPGLGKKQDDDVYHNYTVAKAIEDAHYNNGEAYVRCIVLSG